MPAWRKLRAAEIPAALGEIPEPPEQLYLEGEWPDSSYLYLTVVGSRQVSHYGRECAEKLIGGLSGQPIVIVSGLALGVDTIAHRAALQSRLKTVAFPGSGLDRAVLHPHSNRRLADEIVAAGGALVSEFDPTYPAGLHTFPRRNRLMAGLAKAVLIVEAGEKSGTLITARLALDYNREVLAVPGPIWSSGARGVNRLIREGATPITGRDDILEALGLGRSDSGEPRQLDLTELSNDERRVVTLLRVEPYPRDELIRALGLPIHLANPLFSLMEIKGLIKEAMGEIRLA